MQRYPWVVGVLAVLLTGCGGSGGSSPDTSSITKMLTGVTVTAANSSVDLGFAQQFTATATYNDGSRSDVSSTATWSTGDATIAAVNATGLVSAKSPGSTSVQASFGSMSGSTTATVLPPTAIAVTSPNPDRPAGVTQQFTATATFSDGTHDVSSLATWSTDDTNIATVGSSGLVTAVKTGSTSIKAAFGGVLGSVNFTVDPPVLVSLALSTDTTRMLIGSVHQLSVLGTFSDHSTQDLSSSSAFQLTNIYVGGIDNQQRFTARIDGLASITASSGGISSPALEVQAYSKARFAVVPDASRINSYFVDGSSGLLRPTTYVVRNNLQDECATPSIDRSYVLVGNYRNNSAIPPSGSVSIYKVDAGNGELTLLQDLPQPSGIGNGTYGPGCVVFHPSGKFFYVADETSGFVTAYSFDSITGNAMQLGNSAADLAPRDMTMDPLGRFLYVSNANSGDISAYSIDAATGALTSIPGSPIQSFQGEDIVSIDPRGRYAVVSGNSVNQMRVYSIDSSGTLTLVSGSARSVSEAPSRVVFDPTSSYAYFAGFVLDNNLNAQNVMEVDSFNPSTGALAKVATVNLPAGILPTPVMDPEGKRIYVSDNFGGFYVYPIQGGGTLDSPSHFRAANAINTFTPLALVGGSSAAVASTTHVYAAVPGSKVIAQFNYQSGQLASMAIPQVAAGLVSSLASGFYGRYVFSAAAQSLQPNLYEFSADANTGMLTSLSNEYSSNLQVPEVMTADRNGDFVYSTDSFAPESITAFGRLSPPTPFLESYFPTVTSLGHTSSLALDPFARFVVAANRDQNSISGYDIWGTTAEFSTNLWISPSYATGATPVMVYIEPLGRFAYTANQGSNDISGFQFTNSAGFDSVNSIGANFPVASPSALTGDPFGRLLFVGGTSGSITAYAIDQTSGLLNATVPGVNASGAVQAMTVDASGSNLIVGTSTGLFVYSIGNDGSLTLTVQASPPAAGSYVSLATSTAVQ